MQHPVYELPRISTNTKFVDKGKKKRKGRSVTGAPRPTSVLVFLAESLDDRLHLVVIEGAKRRCPEVARRG
jgi:hypothetical protein